MLSLHAQAVLATSDGIYATLGYTNTTLATLRRHTGALASAWTDQGSGAKTLSQATDAKKPIVETAALGAQPGVVFTRAQLMSLAAPDRSIAGGYYEAWFVGKTLNYDSTSTAGVGAPGTVIGSTSSTWNSFGFYGTELDYVEYSAGYQTTRRGSGLTYDVPRLYGVTHSTGDIRLYVGETQQGATKTTSTFDTTYTGWNSIGATNSEQDFADVVLGAAIVLREASDATFRTKLAKWAMKWTT